jgi:DeoR/GlpR family transcriptional regulator of sugar metabolism
MMRAADEVTILADSTKFGRTSLARLCELGEIDALVTDSQIGEPWRSLLPESGVRLLVAGQEAPSG